MKILVCDDDITTTAYLDGMLRKMGYVPIVCNTGNEALLFLACEEPPKMAIIDWVLPDISGIDVCRNVRNSKTLLSLHIILLTSNNRPEDLAEGLAAGANDYMTKPFSAIELEARLGVGKRIVSLQSEVKTLTGLLPICAWCKKIKSDNQSWVKIEDYVKDRTDASFSHGGCPDCLQRVRQHE